MNTNQVSSIVSIFYVLPRGLPEKSQSVNLRNHKLKKKT